MQDRRFTPVCVLAAGLLACGQDREPGAEVAAGTGGSQTDGSSTGMAAQGAIPAASHTLVGSVTTTVVQGGTASIGNASSGTIANSGGSSSGGVDTSSIGGARSSTPASGGSRAGSTSLASASTFANGGATSTKQSAAGASGGNASAAAGGSAIGLGGGTAATLRGSKRGIAANIAPGAEFFPAVAWWYNWAIRSSGSDVGIEFVPMVWGEASVSSTIPNGSRYLLGFNEPNFFAQANLSSAQAADLWPTLQANASAAGVSLVGPGMNYCGPASQCHGTDPYVYLKDFFSACSNCKVDYVAVHWYNCDLPSLRDYLEPGGNLPGFEQFGKPIWLTEFSCDENASVAQQEAYMRAAIPYLEGNPNVARYSWFSAGPIPNAKLINSDGSATALGRVYISLASNEQ